MGENVSSSDGFINFVKRDRNVGRVALALGTIDLAIAVSNVSTQSIVIPAIASLASMAISGHFYRLDKTTDQVGEEKKTK